MSDQPPKWASRFLRWYCKPSLLEEIEGDAIELYAQRLKKSGTRTANVRYILDVFRFFSKENIRRIGGIDPKGSVGAILNLNLKIAFRNAQKEKFYATLNLAGMALGIAVGILLMLLLQHDLTFDKHYDYTHLYRLGAHTRLSGSDSKSGYSARELGPILTEQFADIKAVVPIERLDRELVRIAEQTTEHSFYVEQIIQSDSNYFKAFLHEFVVGDRGTCLNSPQSVVLSETLASKIFGQDDPLNKSIVIDDRQWNVTAVIKGVRDNSHLKFDMILSGLSNQRDWTKSENGPTSEAFWNPDVYLYLLASDNFSVQSFYDRWPLLYKQHFDEVGRQVGGRNVPVLERLDDIHFYSDLEDSEIHGDLVGLYAFTGVGILIFVLACINYMNLATAKAQNRAKEIVMRKIAGSRKTSLVLSFLVESLAYATLSFALAAGAVYIIINYTTISSLIGRKLELNILMDPIQLLCCLAIVLGIGILSGLYPAFFLARISSISAIQRAVKNQRRGYNFRTLLVTVQLAITLFVVMCTLLMSDQIMFMQNRDLGFTKENILIVPVKDTLVKNSIQVIKDQLLQNPHIRQATTAAEVLGVNIDTGVLWGETAEGWKQAGGIGVLATDANYLKVMGIKLLSGRDFFPGANTDLDGAYIANEAAVKAMGLGPDPLGRGVKFYHGQLQGKVIGVVKDFNFSSLHQSVKPMFIVKADWYRGFLHLRIDSRNISETIEFVRSKFAVHDPRHPFEYFFLDQKFNEQYKTDVIQKRLMSYLSFTCIGISLIGLIGMSAYTALQRTKEIGIRKVLGATIPQIILLLCKSTIGLVFVASILTMPLIVWVINLWMQNFAYQTSLDYFLFLTVVLSASGIVSLTIAIQSFKTSMANPVEALRYQ